MTMIEANELRRHFDNVTAVDSVTLTVKAGEVFGVLGPNGAGKTTMVRLFNGVLSPSGGSARVLGLDPVTHGGQVRRQTGVLTETPSLYERLTARERYRTLSKQGAGLGGTCGRISLAELPDLCRGGERGGVVGDGTHLVPSGDLVAADALGDASYGYFGDGGDGVDFI